MLLIVIIGVALLAFIVGDALTNSRNLLGDGTTVAKAGKEKIDIQDYQRKREELNDRLEKARKENPMQVADFDNQMLSQLAIDQLINESILDQAVDALGIKVQGNLLRHYMLTNTINPKMQDLVQSMRQQGINVQNAEMAFDVIFNPKKNGLTEEQVAPWQRYWVAMENETKQMVARNIYQRIIYGTFQANDLDKKAMHENYIQTSQVTLASMPYGKIDEKKYKVTDAELQQAYQKEKNRFKVDEPTKYVSFITKNVAPSNADRAASQKLAQKVKQEMTAQGAQLSKDSKKAGVATSRRQLRSSDIPAGPVRNFITTAEPGQIDIVAENLQGFTIIKMGSHQTDIDSLKLNIVQVAGSTLPDKVLARLNAGLSVDSLSTAFSPDSVMAQTDQWISLYSQAGKVQDLKESQIDSLVNAGGKYITLVTQPGAGAVLANLIEKKAPKDIYEFEEITYTLKPSQQTMRKAREDLEKFLAKNNNAEAFAANAAKAGYNVVNVDLTQSSPALPAGPQGRLYPDSRSVVRWAMIDGKKGDVSHIYESNDPVNPTLYAAAILAEYDDFMTLDNKEVKDYLTGKIRRDKYGDEMVKKFQKAGTTIEQIAQAMGVTPAEVADFRFGMNPTVTDPVLIGKIAGTKPGAKVIVVKGDNGVYAYRVNGNKKEDVKYNDAQYKSQYMQNFSQKAISEMMRSNKNIKNNVYKFESGD